MSCFGGLPKKSKMIIGIKNRKKVENLDLYILQKKHLLTHLDVNEKK